MITPIVIVDYENRVRSLLGVDEKSIDNLVVNYYEYKGISELSIKRVVPNWEIFYKDKEQAELDVISAATDDERNILNAIIADCTEKISIFESCIVVNTAISLSVAIQYGAIKAEQTAVGAKIEYNGNDVSLNIVCLKDKLTEMLALFNEAQGDTGSGYSIFEVTNPNKRRDSRGSDL